MNIQALLTWKNKKSLNIVEILFPPLPRHQPPPSNGSAIHSSLLDLASHMSPSVTFVQGVVLTGTPTKNSKYKKINLG